jgi:predicted type IV restriction endonuclease
LNSCEDWEIAASKLVKASFLVGCVSGIDSEGGTILIVDAYRDGKRFVVRTDEKVIGFVELERAISKFAVSLIS